MLPALLLVGCTNAPGSYAPIVNVNSQQQRQSTAKLGYYRVRRGDTLYSIAWAYGLDYRALAAANSLSAPYRINPGQMIRVRGVSKRRSYAERQRLIIVRNKTPVKSWRWPARGKVIGRYSRKLSGNKGINIAGRYAEPVRAAAGGRVVYSGDGVRGYGNLIIVKHNNSYLSAYAYNKRNLVRVGQTVRQGQVIAQMGRTNAGRVMLHFEIRRNGRPINPLTRLGRMS